VFIVVDTVSKNVLGEFESLAAAKALFLRLVASHPAAARELKVLTSAGREEEVSADEIQSALAEAVAA
jgi:hypothetical protein